MPISLLISLLISGTLVIIQAICLRVVQIMIRLFALTDLDRILEIERALVPEISLPWLDIPSALPALPKNVLGLRRTTEESTVGENLWVPHLLGAGAPHLHCDPP